MILSTVFCLPQERPSPDKILQFCAFNVAYSPVLYYYFVSLGNFKSLNLQNMRQKKGGIYGIHT